MAQIDKPNLHFTTNTYTGTNGNQTFNLGFQPDWIWTKNKNTGYNHVVVDSVRGITKVISPNNTNAEGTCTEGITSITSTGYTIGANTSSGGFEDDFNGTYNSPTYVSWNWKAGTTSGITQGGASITPTAYSFNQTSGFSIIRYTGTGSNATIPHGLGKVPKMIIARNITDGEQWTTYHVGLDASAPEDYHLRLNTDGARVDEAAVWNDTAPTVNVFSVGSSGAPNGSGDNHIAYCFAEIKGYSKFGKYTGNGSADGTFVYTGFKPAFVITKRITDGTESWHLFDNKRNPFNVVDKRFQVNSTGAEDTNAPLGDFVSNGFKIRGTGGGINVNAKEFIYMAFAEEPLVGSNNIPATAR